MDYSTNPLSNFPFGIMGRRAASILAPLIFPEGKRLVHTVCREAEWAGVPRVQMRQYYGQECKPEGKPNPTVVTV